MVAVVLSTHAGFGNTVTVVVQREALLPAVEHLRKIGGGSITVSELAYVFLRQLQASPFALGGTNGTRLFGDLERDPGTGTFSFSAKLVLRQPIKL